MPLEGSERLLALGRTPLGQKVLVVGGAGAGKSSTLASLVARLRDSSIPVLAIPFDHLPEGLLTTTELGAKLLLPESPALVLDGVAAGKPCVLIIDQLDAVSIASGRRAELWALFDRLHREVERLPNMFLVVGCREFDLEHDQRMRTMKATTPGFSIETLKPLSLEQVETALQDAGIDVRTVQPTLKPILAVPLHLSMFLSLTARNRVAVRSRDELFDAFWVQGEQRTDVRLGRKTAWTQVIDRLANWLSETQQLVRRGTPTMRKAAAKIYAANVADDSAGRSCRQLAKSFFTDPDDAVRAEAASAFLNLASLETSDQSDLLAAFLEAAPGPVALKPVVRALEESPVQLPDLVCGLAEMCAAAYREEAGDILTEARWSPWICRRS